MSNAGVTYSQNGELKTISQEQAIGMLEQITRRDSKRGLVHSHKLTQDNPNALQLLGYFYGQLMHLYMFDELLELATQRLTRVRDCPVAFSYKLDALKHTFRNQEAIAMLRAAYLRDPQDENTLSILGSYYKDEGERENALSSFNLAIEVNPNSAASYWHRAELVNDHERAYDQVAEQIANGDDRSGEPYYLQFAAYRHAEKKGDVQTAFEHLSFANGLKRHALDYNVEQELTVDAQAKKVFTPHYLATLTRAKQTSLDGHSKRDFKPIFILGMPRSGTTLVEQIISSHSDVAAGDEYTALSNAIMRVQQDSQFVGGIDDWLASRNVEDWSKIGRSYESNTRFLRKEKRVFTDKNQFNHRSVGVILAALPHAKIVVVDRNPMDVLFGCYRQLFGGQGAAFSYDFAELVRYYQSYNGLIDYWCEHTQGLIKRVSYEALVNNTRTVTDELLAFCGLSSEQACHEFHKTQRSVKTLSSLQVRQPIFKHGLNRWKTYEAQLAGLVQAAAAAGIEIS